MRPILYRTMEVLHLFLDEVGRLDRGLLSIVSGHPCPRSQIDSIHLVLSSVLPAPGFI